MLSAASTPRPPSQEGLYDCVLSDPCSITTIVSEPVQLTVCKRPATCDGDSDDNGVINFADITAVLGRFNITCP